jgi:hypothetical protein
MHPIIRNALIGGGSGGGGGPFYPTSLFSSGEKGLFYDFSDMASLFQDVAGTTPITESGQTSARINDLSGNGNYATQPTTAWRPQFVQAGGLNYMSLDGVDDEWATSAAMALGGTDIVTVCAGVRKLNDAAGMVCESNPSITSTPGSIMLFSGVGSLGTGYTSTSRGDATYIASLGAFSSAIGDNKSVLYSTHSISGDLSTLRKNGIDGASSVVDKGSGSFADYILYIGGRGSGSIQFYGHIYSLLIIARSLTTTERSQLEAWTAVKSGVTL